MNEVTSFMSYYLELRSLHEQKNINEVTSFMSLFFYDYYSQIYLLNKIERG